jgi:hypothetical protein
MDQYTLTMLDTTGIQEYIFGSNRLQENIGASELVFRATSLWAFEALEAAGLKRDEHNIRHPLSLDWEFSDRVIEDGKSPLLQAEVIQSAGGNMFILFRSRETSREFVRKLTLGLLKNAPGLTVLAWHLDNYLFEAQKLDLPQKRDELMRCMQIHKLSRLPSSPTLGLGVTAVCESTGLPAVVTLAGEMEVEREAEPFGLDGEDMSTRISSQVAAKRAWRGQSNLRLKHYLRDAAREFVFPYDLDKIGRVKGEESYVAVVHADGNCMSERVKRETIHVKNNREWIEALRSFSISLNGACLAALQSIVHMVVQAVEKDLIPHEEKDGKKYLPFRPLVFGGDDVTFVCNGSIGVSLAAAYLKEFQEEARVRGLKDLFASAGVSIVKLHYPFARAYALSEELTKSAKSLTRKDDCSALDWHFAQSGLSGSLEAIRHREYTSFGGKSLCLRPLTLERGDNSWQNVEKALEEFQGDYWGRKHNKVLGLLEPLRKGADCVTQYRLDFGLKSLPLISDKAAQESGWRDSTCYYFDLVELLDHYVPLSSKEGK